MCVCVCLCMYMETGKTMLEMTAMDEVQQDVGGTEEGAKRKEGVWRVNHRLE